ncbi:MAG: hypothetical protein ACEPOW_09330 [Bacteroidales bacterium]
MSIPILLFEIYHQQWSSIFIFLFLLPIVILDWDVSRFQVRRNFFDWIPSDAIEWKAGLRKYFWFFSLVWLLTIVTSFFVGSIPLGLFLLGVLCVNFFENCESDQILYSYERSPKSLIKLKLIRQLELFALCTWPLIGLFLFFHWDYWYILVIEFFVFCSLHLYMICLKYAFFKPGKKSTTTVLYGIIGFICSITTILLPIVWLMSIWFYYQSLQKLNFYLDDYN